MNVHIYVMNPEKFVDRRKAIEPLLTESGYKYSFTSINDETELSDKGIERNHNSKKTIDFFGRDFTIGELASTLNHLHAYNEFLNSSYDIAIIIEDDQTFDVTEFKKVISFITSKVIDLEKPEAILLTPVISYLEKESLKITEKYKISPVFEAWGQAYVINRLAAKNILRTNTGSWIIADDWVKYKRYAKINLLGIIPGVVRTDESFESNLMIDRKKTSRTSKTANFILRRLFYKITRDIYKFFWLYPVKNLQRDKSGFR